MADFYQDLFAGTASTNLSSHSPTIGSGYTASSALAGPILLDGAGWIYSTVGSGYYFTASLPVTQPGDYEISFDVKTSTSANGDTAGWIVHGPTGLGTYNYAAIINTAGTVKFSLATNVGAVGESITVAAGAGAVYNCKIGIQGADLYGSISGGELSGIHTIYAPGAAVAGATNNHGPFLSIGTPSTHYQIGNAAGAPFSIFYKDIFTGTALTDLTAHSPDIGNAYVASAGLPGPILLDGSNAIYNSSGSGLYIQSAVPGTTPGDYLIGFDVIMRSSANADTAGWCVRTDAALSNFYRATIDQAAGAITFSLKNTSGTTLGTPVSIPTPGSFPATFHCTVQVQGSDITGTVAGPGLSEQQTIFVAGGAPNQTPTGHGPLLSPGTILAHYELANAIGLVPTTVPSTTTPISSGFLPTLGLSQEMWDTTNAGSGYIDNLLPGGQLDFNVNIVTANSTVTLNCDLTNTSSCRVATIVDGTYQSVTTLTSGTTSISVTGLSVGTHRIQFHNVGLASGGGSRFVLGATSQNWRVVSVSIPSDASYGVSSRPANYFMCVTDSIGEGYNTLNDGTTNNYYSWCNQLSIQLNKVLSGTMINGIGVSAAGTNYPVGALAFSGSGFPTNGTSDGWDHIHSTLARSFSQAPDFIMLCIGTNEWATDTNVVGHNTPNTNSLDVNMITNLGTFISRVRGKLPTTPLYICVPYGGYKRTPIQSAVTQYKASNPTEANLYVHDLAHGSANLLTSGPSSINEVTLFGGLTKDRPDDVGTIASPQAADRTHPNAAADLQIATIMQTFFSVTPFNSAPASGVLNSGGVTITGTTSDPILTAARATGGSAIYTYQFQHSTDSGVTWSNIGSAIDNQSSTISPFITYTSSGESAGTKYRVKVVDGDDSPSTAYGGVAKPLIFGIDIGQFVITADNIIFKIS